MAKRAPLSAEEAAELFSHLNESGLVDASSGRDDRDAGRVDIDPLSNQDPSGSKAGDAISKTAIACIVLVLVAVVGVQLSYGIIRRLNTANLSESVSVETVQSAMESGVEWGNGFTQFPSEFTVDEASETSGVVEVSVVDTDSENELELLSSSQIQASALATNALLNDRITRVVYNVYALLDEDGNIQCDAFFGLVSASGEKTAMLSFIWTKSGSGSSNIDWELTIIGLDEAVTEAIQEQVNSVSSITNDSTVSQSEIEDEIGELELERSERSGSIFTGTADEIADGESSLVDDLVELLTDAMDSSAGDSAGEASGSGDAS